MQSALISIVMPSFNQASFIKASILSVLQQDWDNLELIVADGGSTDGTVDLLKQLSAADSRLRWVSDTDTGPASALNKAIAMARGTLVGWLNSDDLYTPGALRRAAEALEANPSWMLVYGQGEHIDEAGHSLESYPSLPASTPIEKFSEGCFICQPTVFFSRTLPLLIGKLDENLSCAFDFEYWLRAFNKFPERIGFIDALQAQSRLHDACITNNQRRRVALEGMEVLHRHLGKAPGVWIETYLEELLSGTAEPETGMSLRASLEGLLEDAQAYLEAAEYQRVATRIRMEAGLDQQTDKQVEEHLDIKKPIDPKEMISRYSLAEHVKQADAYFAGREAEIFLYQKPFFHPQDCAPMLSNLGDLFAGLQLKVGMRVLDFAAGSGWLSRYLTQLGCEVICSDVSVNALDIAKDLFVRFPPIAQSYVEPEFLVFDGLTINLPSASLDRIVVNDAFHHLPNTAAILAEFARVLKPGGIVGMSEPGRFHSQTEDSQFEMREFNVIENDVVLESLWEEASEAGFADIAICPVISASHMNLQEYQACIEGEVSSRLQNLLKEGTLNHSIFFLYKSTKDNLNRQNAGIANDREQFDEAWYLQEFPDVVDAIKQGFFVDAWAHYEAYGRREGRRGFPLMTPSFDLVSFILSIRPDLHALFPEQDKRRREKLIQWLLGAGYLEYASVFDDPSLYANLHEKGYGPRACLNLLQHRVRSVRADIRKAFALPKQLAEFEQWYYTHAIEELPIWRLLSKEEQQRVLAQPEPWGDRLKAHILEQLPPARRQVPITQRGFGANVVGYAYGQLGIGEDARMATRALHAAGVPAVLVDYPPGKDIPQNDRSMAKHVALDGAYPVNIFCMTAEENGRFYAERGSAQFVDRYNIGYWPWELGKWPENWEMVLALVDEVWVSTQHTLDALKTVCDKPLKLMPMAVDLGPVRPFASRKQARKHFALPESPTLFCFAFDLNSWVQRKNPQACIDAFLAAFPRKRFGSNKVGLVIKTGKPKGPHRLWSQLKKLVAEDDRIHVIEETLPRPDLLALYKACECFISLHRAEGFGRGMAEALQLGQHVICTGYSGNVDFCKPPHADLVRYDLVKVRKNQYVHTKGQVWAEPDVEHAAKLMRAFVKQGPKRRRNAWKQFAVDTVGARYRDRLEEIMESLQEAEHYAKYPRA